MKIINWVVYMHYYITHSYLSKRNL